VPGHEEVDEVANLGALGLRQPGEASVRRPAKPKSPELVGEPRALDPPEGLEELDERDPGRIRCAQKIGRRRARPRRSGGIEERCHIPGITAQHGAQGAHREARAGKDVAKPGAELVVGWHRVILS